MANVSPTLFDAMESGIALMEVMKQTAVSFPLIYFDSCQLLYHNLCCQPYLKITCYICTDSCQSGVFQCSNGQCISSFERCDGNRNCINGSDETGCGELLKYLGSGGWEYIRGHECSFRQPRLLPCHYCYCTSFHCTYCTVLSRWHGLSYIAQVCKWGVGTPTSKCHCWSCILKLPQQTWASKMLIQVNLLLVG